MFRCFYHGCPIHYADDQTPIVGGKTAGKVRERSKIREDTLRELGKVKNFELKIVWECEIRDELKLNKGMRDFFENCEFAGALKLRDALFGGRVEVFNL